VSGRFFFFTDENIDGPIIRGLRQRWMLHATRELGEETKDAPLFQLAASLDRVFVSTDKHMLQLAKK
jgi:predicted nuclease of predicted toxin-antitoxin system